MDMALKNGIPFPLTIPKELPIHEIWMKVHVML